MLPKFLLLLLLVAIPSLGQAQIYEPHCNGRRISGIEQAAKDTPKQFEKTCYEYARDLIYKATGHDYYLDEAQGVLETLKKVNPPSPYPDIGYAELHIKLRELGQPSISLFNIYQQAELATRGKSPPAEAYVTLGKVGLLMNCLLCAESVAKKAQKIGGDTPEVILLLASVDEARRDYGLAKKKLNAVLTQGTDSITPRVASNIFNKLALLNAKEKQYELAQNELKKTISINPDNPIPFIALAELQLFWMGDPDAAIQSTKKANRIKTTIEAKRLESFSEYLIWSSGYLKNQNLSNINKLKQTSLLSPQEAFVLSARYSGLSKISEALLKAMVVKDIELRDGHGNTALIAAGIGNNEALAYFLTKNHANVNSQNSNGERALTFFVTNGNYKAVRMLLEVGAQVNYIDVNGNSPLSIAVFRQDGLIIKELLKHGALIDQVVILAKKFGMNEIEIERLIGDLRKVSI